jgi:GxxExxY protein
MVFASEIFIVMELIYKEEVYRIIGACMEVHKELGGGFHEGVYQEAAEIEFEEKGIPFQREEGLKIYYRGRELKKSYVADFICYEKVIVEFKAISGLLDDHIWQVINYLKATDLKLGLLINFGGKKLTYKRIILS